MHQPGLIAISETVLANLNNQASQASSATKSAGASSTTSPAAGPSSNSATPGTLANQTGVAASDSNKNEMPQAVIIGLAVGISLAVLLIAALVFFGMQFRKRNQASKSPEMASGGSNLYDNQYPNNALHTLSPNHQALNSQHLYNHHSQPQSHQDLNRQYSQHHYMQDTKDHQTHMPVSELGDRAAAELDVSRPRH